MKSNIVYETRNVYMDKARPFSLQKSDIKISPRINDFYTDTWGYAILFINNRNTSIPIYRVFKKDVWV